MGRWHVLPVHQSIRYRGFNVATSPPGEATNPLHVLSGQNSRSRCPSSMRRERSSDNARECRDVSLSRHELSHFAAYPSERPGSPVYEDNHRVLGLNRGSPQVFSVKVRPCARSANTQVMMANRIYNVATSHHLSSYINLGTEGCVV